MTIREKMIKSDNKIEQHKAQYDLDRQTGEILSLTLGNVGKFEFLTDADVLQE